ncbi:HEAT repeat protein [Desulfitispora alkaliphila]|uniref:HEAT repeat domain-containing protein n=1 Tax=Desulfitispora alkaliphila TaxID=622674 RepID=UPI003D1ED62B
MLTKAFNKIRIGLGTKEDLLEQIKCDLNDTGGKLSLELQERILSLEVPEIAMIINSCHNMSVVTRQSLKRILDAAGIIDELMELAGTKKSGASRFAAIETLGLLSIDKAADLLLNVLTEKDELVQLAAAGALWQLNSRLLIPRILEDLGKGTWPVAHTGKILLKHPELVFKRLEEIVYNKEDGLLDAVELLKHFKTPEAYEALKYCLSDSCPEVRVKALMGLTDSGIEKSNSVVLASVLDVVGDQHWKVRLFALQWIKKHRGEEDVLSNAKIEALKGDENPKVRAVARQIWN